MQELTPVGLSKDGKSLVLISARGVEFTVPIDQRFRDAMRGDQNRLAQLEMTMENTLRPKDIQSRIRSGETAEAVAAAANSSIDKIMVYAGPVLAERAHIAQSAQLASIRRKNADSSVSARTLSEAAPPYFRGTSTHPDDVEWDAWRRDDGRWTVVALFQLDGAPERAEFTYDMPGRYVVAENDHARQLTGEIRPPAAAEPRAAGRRLSAVPDQDALPLGDDLGDDALEMVRERDSLTADHADADWIVGDDEVTTEINVPDAAPDEAGAPSWLEPAGPAAPEEPEEPEATREPEPEPEPAPAPKGKKRGRAQVPSWDEIMFGTKND